MQLSTQVFALSNASQFGVSYSTYGGKKSNVPIVYTLEVNSGKLEIYFHKLESVKNEVTGVNESKHVKQIVGTIQASPGNLYINLKQDLLPTKLSSDQHKFHHEIIWGSAIPYWVRQASDLVEYNQIAPVWLIVAKLIQLTCYDNKDDFLDIYDLQTVKPFNPDQWVTVLQECAKELPAVKQYQNALRTVVVQPIVEELPSSDNEPTEEFEELPLEPVVPDPTIKPADLNSEPVDPAK